MNAVAKMTKALDVARQATKEAGDGIEQIRAAIAVKVDEREQIAAAPVPYDVALQRLNAWTDRLAEPLHRFGMWKFSEFEDYRAPTIGDPAWFMLAASAELARPILIADLAAWYEKHAPLDDSDRAARLKKLDAELLDLELAEESLIRETERAGMTILRRANADPRAVLAHDGDLP